MRRLGAGNKKALQACKTFTRYLRLITILLLRATQKLVRNLVHPFHQQVMVVHVVIILIFKLVLLTMLR